jgi:hypothetical protein
MSISERLKEIRKSPYAIVAERCDTTERFVGQIARGERKGLRGKGLRVKEELAMLLLNNSREQSTGNS